MSGKKTVTKKSAAKKGPAKGPVAAPPETKIEAAGSVAAVDTELHGRAYTLAALLTRTAAGPAVTAEQVMVYIDLPPEQLVAAGQAVRTERINTDSARLYGTALDFFEVATKEQRAAVPGVTGQRLRVSIWAAAQGEAKNQAMIVAEERSAAEQGYRVIDAKQLKDKARAVREVLYATLFALAGGHKLRVKKLRVAYGRYASAEDLAGSLTALAGLYDLYQGDPDPKLTARRADMTLDSALAVQARALAAQVLVRVGAANAPRTALSNAEVDLWDGINLQLLDQIITIFDAGHLLDPTVPRLLPASLRGWFGRRSVKAATGDPESGESAE